MRIILFLLLANAIYAQKKGCKVVVEYAFKWVSDSIKMSTLTENYVLVINEGVKSFYNFSHKYNDSIFDAAGHSNRNKSEKDTKDFIRAWNEGKFTSLLREYRSDLMYYSENGMEYIRYRDVLIPMFYSLKIKSPVWEIKSETKKISGLDVRMATAFYSGRKYIAWFAPSIPIREGPYVFRNLPGLVVKVYDENLNFTFDLENYQNCKKEYFSFDSINSNYREVSISEWVDIRRNNYYNPKATLFKTKEEKENYKKRNFINRHLLIEQQ